MYHGIVEDVVNLAVHPAVLAHVLAHEIGHVLQSTDAHSSAGVMKARCRGSDYAAMRSPLEFTPPDAQQIPGRAQPKDSAVGQRGSARFTRYAFTVEMRYWAFGKNAIGPLEKTGPSPRQARG